jgi:hypothetical protein
MDKTLKRSETDADKQTVTPADWNQLRLVQQGHRVLWSPKDLRRLVRLDMLTMSGILTEYGQSRLDVFNEYLAEVRNGVPLSRVQPPGYDFNKEIKHIGWMKGRLSIGSTVSYCEHVMVSLRNKCSHSALNVDYILEERIEKECIGYCESNSWKTVEPVAYQLNDVEDARVVCFWDSESQHIHRMHAALYFWLSDEFVHYGWKSLGQGKPIALQTSKGLLPGSLSALVMPISGNFIPIKMILEDGRVVSERRPNKKTR